MATIAHLGTGLLGTAMVERHLAVGESVTVWNRTPAKATGLEVKGARLAATIAEAVKGAERVHLTLSDDAAVDALLPAVLAALAPGAWVIDHTTTSVFGTRERYARLEAAKVRFVHAPVFMSPAMAREGKGMILLSGPREWWETLRASLEPMTGDVWYVGARLEEAAAYKLFGNAMILVIGGGMADILAMARGMGLEPRDALGVFERLIPGVHARAARMADGDFTPSFELAMARKDLGLALEAAERSQLPLAVLPGLAKRFDDVIAEGHGKDDYSIIAAPAVAGSGDEPFGQLERCHRRLEEKLAEYARSIEDAEAHARFFDFIDRSIQRHEADEEDSLFPRLAGVAALAPVIASIHAEHEKQKELLGVLRAAKGADETRRAFKAVEESYRGHIEREERLLFPPARQALGADVKRQIAGEMQARRGREGGRRGDGERRGMGGEVEGAAEVEGGGGGGGGGGGRR